MNFEDHIGENIKSVRIAKKLSQQDLADLCGISNTVISQYENGRKTPGLSTLARIAKNLGVSIERLYYGDESVAFINSEPDMGGKIVNAIQFLWLNGIANYAGAHNYGAVQSPGGFNKDSSGLFLAIYKYRLQIMRLIQSLNAFKRDKDTYADPDGFLEMLLASVATEINVEIKKNGNSIVTKTNF